MNNKHLSWNKEINNKFIIASRAYFLHQGINPVGDNAQAIKYLHKQTPTCTQRDKGVVNPFTVICKVRSDIDG